MLLRLLVGSTLVLFSYAISWSCTCVYIPTFCETLTFWDGVIDTNYLIVHARAEDKLSDGLRITVISELFGHTEKNSLTIRKGNGANCLVNTDFFDEGQEYIFAFHGAYEGKHNLSSCGVSWLTVENGIATGEITETLKSHPVSAFNKILECPGLQAGNGAISVFPNPVNTTVKLLLDGGSDKVLEIHIFDTAGRLVLSRTKQTISPEAPYQLDMRSLAQGIYFMQYQIGGVLYSEKIMVAGPI